MKTSDPRPVAYCRRCKTDVVLMPNGTCQWCDMRVRKDRRNVQVERLHRERLRAA